MVHIGNLRSLPKDHLGWNSVWEQYHLIGNQVLLEGLSVARVAMPRCLLISVALRVENVSDPNTRVICHMANSHFVNSTESLSMAEFDVRDWSPRLDG